MEYRGFADRGQTVRFELWICVIDILCHYMLLYYISLAMVSNLKARAIWRARCIQCSCPSKLCREVYRSLTACLGRYECGELLLTETFNLNSAQDTLFVRAAAI